MKDLCGIKIKATIIEMILQKQRSQTHEQVAKKINLAPKLSYTRKNIISGSKRVSVDSHGVFMSSQLTRYNYTLVEKSTYVAGFLAIIRCGFDPSHLC